MVEEVVVLGEEAPEAEELVCRELQSQPHPSPMDPNPPPKFRLGDLLDESKVEELETKSMAPLSMGVDIQIQTQPGMGRLDLGFLFFSGRSHGEELHHMLVPPTCIMTNMERLMTAPGLEVS